MPRSIAGAGALLALLVVLVAPGDAAAAAPVTGQGLTGVVNQVQTVAAGAGDAVNHVGQVATGTVQRVSDPALGAGEDAVDQVAPQVDLPKGGGPAKGTATDPGAPAAQQPAPPPGATRSPAPDPAPEAGGLSAKPRHRGSGTTAEGVPTVPATRDATTAPLWTAHPSGPTAAPRGTAGAAGPDGSFPGRTSFAAGGAAGSPAAGFSGTGLAILLATLFLAASALSTPLRLSRVSSAPAPLVFALERPG